MNEKMMIEATKRMMMMNLHPNVIKEFKRERKLNKTIPTGSLIWLDEDERKMVKELEDKTGGIAFHVIHSYTNIGEMYAILYVSKHEEEWQMDRANISENLSFAYVVNKDDDNLSEFGTVGYQNRFGGLVRRF